MTTIAAAAEPGHVRSGRLAAGERIAGLAGIIFAVLLIVQNVVKAATSPPDDATAAQVLRFAHHDAWTVHLLVVTYVIGFPALFLFAGGLVGRAREVTPRSEIWGRLGLSSVGVIAVLFGFLNVLQVVLVADRTGLAHDPTAVSAIWTLHNAIFTMNLLAVGGALLGLGRAAWVAGLVPRRLGIATIVGALLLAVAAAPAVAEVHGSNLLVIGLAGFLCWLVFVVVVSGRLIAAPDRTASV
jgi:hypothetical protein